MKHIAKNLRNTASLILFLILASLLAAPSFSMAARAKADTIGKAQRFKDPQRLQKAIHVLIQKAQTQQRIINDWHRRSRLEAEKARAKNRKVAVKMSPATTRACHIQLAMARTQEDITIPGCRIDLKNHVSLRK